jgi:farnesyl-diphosphate farnesyltransferase
MLTKLFCDYSPEIAERREVLMSLAVSFGQGLQMTNILKDIWDDRRRGACWLPRDVFTEVGFDLRELDPGRYQTSFSQGLARLIGIAHNHLRDALTYTLLIPRCETGIRNFCLWALAMAMLTLRKINRHRNFSVSSQVKISRRSVRATMLTSRWTVSHDYLLRSLFHLSSMGLPHAPKPESFPDDPQ